MEKQSAEEPNGGPLTTIKKLQISLSQEAAGAHADSEPAVMKTDDASTTSFASQAPPQKPDPSYPSSFAAIVDLIARNEKIPGVEHIPDTVLSPSLSKPNTTVLRKKPWESASTVAQGRDPMQSIEHPSVQASIRDDTMVGSN